MTILEAIEAHTKSRKVAPECSLMLITPAMVRDYKDYFEINGIWPGQRRQKPRQQALIARDITEGNWIINGETIVFDRSGKCRNGMNRMESVLQADKPIKTFCVFGIEDDYKTMATIDDGVRRSLADLLYIAGHKNCNQLEAITRLVFLFEVNRLRFAGSGNIASVSALYEVFNDNHDIVDALEFVNHHRSEWRGVCRSGIIGFMRLITHRIDATKSDKFIEAFCDARGGITNPPVALHKKLIDLKLKMSRARTRSVQPSTELAYWIKAWNAFYDGKRVKGIALGKVFPAIKGI